MSAILPYPGLRPFYRSEADIFFGREEQTDQLQDLLGNSRFLAVVGPSGCGKTSLVRAGLISSLETGFMRSAGVDWKVVTMRPGNYPLQRLAEALLEESALPNRKGCDAAGFLQATLRRGPLGLTEALRETPLPADTNLLLVVDQFEEIFRFRKEGGIDEADAFVSLLLESAFGSGMPVYVVLTMRSDYLGDCALLSGLPEAINGNQYLTPRLTREQCRSAIVGPARVFGGDVERRLANCLLNDMGRDPDQLPLMQHLLMRMWTRNSVSGASAKESHADSSRGVASEANCQVLTLEDYEAAGGLARSLSTHADEVFNALDAEQRHVAEVMFRCLSERGRDQRDARRPVPLGEVAEVAGVAAEIVGTVADAFRQPDCNFISPSVKECLTPHTVLDISHESLIRQWERLNAWVRQESESAETYSLLEQTARLWEEGKAALWGTPNLENALAWKEREDPTETWARRYGGNFGQAMEFLGASVEERRAEKKREEAEQKRRLEVERLRAEERHQAAVRLQRYVGVLAVASVLLVIAVLFAFDQRDDARQQGRIASARALAAAATNNLDIDPERSVLLALEAASLTFATDRTVTPESEDALHRAVQASRIRFTLAGHDAIVYSAAFHPRGSLLATASEDETVKVWDLASGEEKLTILGHSAKVYSVAFSPDGERLATASRDKTVKVWDLAGHEVLTLVGHEHWVNGVAFSPDGNRIATASWDGTARVWDSVSGEELRVLSGHAGAVFCVAFSSNGSLLATASADGTAKVWDLDSIREPLTISGHVDDVYGVAFSPIESAILATASGDKTVRIWDPSSGEELQVLSGHTNAVYGVAFSGNGRRLASAGFDRQVIVWDTSSGDILTTLSGHTARAFSVTFSPDGERLATTSADHTAKVWYAGPAEELPSLSVNTALLDVAFSPNGTKVAIAGLDSTAIIWEVHSSKRKPQILSGHADVVHGVAYSPDGNRLATASFDGTAKVWDGASGREQMTLSGHGGPVNNVAFSPHGGRIGTCSRDTTAKIWDADSGRELLTLSGHSAEVFDLAFSPDGAMLATASRDQTIRIWDMVSGKELMSLPEQDNWITGIAFSPDGGRLATADRDGIARIWDISSGGQQLSLTGHRGGLLDLAFSPDGKRLATGSIDGTTRIWDAETGVELFALTGHTADVSGVAFSPDGRLLATSGYDATARVYAVAIDDLIELARARVTRPLSREECRKYLLVEACPPPAVNSSSGDQIS